jgi:superoxide dismutase, Fe-Mn family
MFEYYPFDLIPLRYPYYALEPHISEASLREHHAKHLDGCVQSLNSVLDRYPQYQKWPLEKLVKNYRAVLPEIHASIKNNAASVYNHNFLFNIMGPDCVPPEGQFLEAVIKYFGSQETFLDQWKESAVKVHASGYTWLAMNDAKQLLIVNTTDCILNLGLSPVLVIDLWEHAYYLQYKNDREAYIDNWLQIINWPSVQGYYNYYLSHN